MLISNLRKNPISPDKRKILIYSLFRTLPRKPNFFFFLGDLGLDPRRDRAIGILIYSWPGGRDSLAALLNTRESARGL